MPNASEIPVRLQVLDSYGTIDALEYSFFTSGYNTPDAIVPVIGAGVGGRVCDGSKPSFPPTDHGLVAALDAGVGTEVDLRWRLAVPSNDGNIVYYNVYYSTIRDQVFDGQPEFLVTDIQATVGGLCPGDTNFFGLRAAEFDPELISTTGMRQSGPNMFRYPVTSLAANIDADDMVISVDALDGFPRSGVVKFDGELVRYSSLQISPPALIVQSRGFAGTLASYHELGKVVTIYHGREDSNTNIIQATSTFQKPTDPLTWVLTDGHGPDGYRDGYDGYDKIYNNFPGADDMFDGYDGYFRFRQESFDNLTTDGTNNDNSGDFNRFDYCGTWRAVSPAQFMQGQCGQGRGSYWGGVQVNENGDKVKTPDVRTHMLQREELLLESHGEPFSLVRRMWTGIRCACVMLRREHAHSRCPLCFGTGFTQGYVQFFNPRRQDRRILVRVDPATEDLKIVDRGGLEPMYEPSAWTLPFPAVKDRDFLVRFTPEGIEEWRYEILDVTRIRSFFAQSGAQKFRMKRIPKTDTIYQFPVLRDATPRPGAILTSINSGAGLEPHAHQLIVPDGANLGKMGVATLVSEGHNHAIINGVVQSVLGHTHTL